MVSIFWKRKNFRPQAERTVKTRLALEKIVQLEKIEISDEDLEKELNIMSETYSMPVEQIKAVVPTEDIAADLAVQKAMALVKDNAKLTEVKELTKKEEAKKPAAKKTTTKKATATGEKKTTAAKKPAAKKTTTTAKKTTTTKKTTKAEDKAE